MPSSPNRQQTAALTVRELQSGDAPEIIEKFNSIFNQTRSRDHWEWKFNRNPHGSLTGAIAADDSGRVVGHYGVIPLFLNLNGKPVLACQSADLFLTPEHRGADVLDQIGHVYDSLCTDRGMSCVYALPNRKSYGSLIHRWGYQKLFELKHYTRRLSIEAELGRMLKLRLAAKTMAAIYRRALGISLRLQAISIERRRPGRWEFQSGATVPEGYEALWQRLKYFEVVSVWKDAKYLRWRYEQHPDRKFEFATLVCDGNLEAMAVVTAEPEAKICELFVNQKSLLVARLLLTKIQEHGLLSGWTKLTFEGHDGGFFDEAFAGWERLICFTQTILLKVYGEIGQPLTAPYHWSFTAGDMDTV